MLKNIVKGVEGLFVCFPVDSWTLFQTKKAVVIIYHSNSYAIFSRFRAITPCYFSG
jgi:hypothetical protein